MINQRKPVFPVPEALPVRSKGPWQIEEQTDGGGNVSLDHRIMSVPLGNSAQEELIRAHEMMHAHISPWYPSKMATKHGVSLAALQFAEDLRVHLYLRHHAGVDTSSGISSDAGLADMAENVALHENLEGAVLAAVASGYTGDFERWIAALQARDRTMAQDVKQIALRAQELMGLGRATFQNSIDVARYVDAAVADYRKRRQQQIRAQHQARQEALQQSAQQAQAAMQQAAPIFKQPLQKIELTREELLQQVEGELQQQMLSMSGTGMGNNQKWAELHIENVPLTLPFPGSLGRKTRRPSTEGALPLYIQRYCLGDGSIFARSRKRQGGTVLIDGSGSMNLTREQLVALVTAAPGAKVAIYGSPDRGRQGGYLRIVADQQRRAADAEIKSPGLDNCVDGPALRWLALQKRPLIWVSDGRVTGVTEAWVGAPSEVGGGFPNGAVECVRLCQVHGIKQLEKVDQAIEYLQLLAGKSRR